MHGRAYCLYFYSADAEVFRRYFNLTEYTYTAQAGGSRLYRNGRTKFAAAYYTKNEIKDMYPAGGYSVVAQIGKGRTKQGELLSDGVSEPIYAVAKMPHSAIKGYIPVGEREYVVIVKDVLVLWILFALLAALIVAALGFFIHQAIAANGVGGAPETSTNPKGVVDANAQEGEGEWSVPDKIDTAGKNIKINGITDLKLKAGVREQNFVLSNPKENPCYFKYEIVLTETDEVIYTSQLVPPGYAISKFSLNRALEAGSYRAVIHVKTYTFDKQQRPLNNFDMKTNVTVEE